MNPLLLIPSVAERVYFQDFYDRLSVAIRKVDPDTFICFEPITWDNGYRGGFSHPPGGKRYQNLSAYSYHFYSPPDKNLQKTIKARINDAKRLGVPSFLSEFWVKGFETIAQEVVKYKQSLMFWGYKDFGKNWGSSLSSEQNLGGIYRPDGNPDQKIISAISQTYMTKVAG